MGSRIEFQFVPAPGRDHVDQSWVNSVIEGLNVNHWTPISRTTREDCAHMRYVHRLLQLDEEGEEIEDEYLDELEDLCEEDTTVDSPWIWDAHDSNHFRDHPSADEMGEAHLHVHTRSAVLPSLRESPITNETVQQILDNHWRLYEDGISVYHPSAPSHVPQSDDDEDEDEDDDLRPSEHKPLSDDEGTPPLDETFPLDEPFPVIDIRPEHTGV